MLKHAYRRNYKFPMRSFQSGSLHFCPWVGLSIYRTVILWLTVFREEMFMVLGNSTLD
nr:Ubiquitin-specific protease 12 isoform 3 [Ipomoea batatas]